MMKSEPFLADQIENYDSVLIEVLAAPHPQTLRAKVKKIYSWGKGVTELCNGSEVDFVRAPGGWGDEHLEVGEQAIVFLCAISGRLYESGWHGHMVIEEIEGEKFAIYQHRDLWLDPRVPPLIRANSKQDPKRPYASAIRFDSVESYLESMLEKMGRSSH